MRESSKPRVESKNLEAEDIEVRYETVSPQTEDPASEPVAEEEDFEITNMTVREAEVVDPEQEDNENQFSFTFDLPIPKSKPESGKVRTMEKVNINDIEIVGLEYVRPEKKQRVDEETVRHNLEEEFAPEINALKSVARVFAGNGGEK